MNIDKVLDSFNRKGFHANYFATPKEAIDFLCSEITATSIGMGGSMTLQDLHIAEALAKSNTVYPHISGDLENVKKTREAKVYMLSANALSSTGEIVNIDGYGNRVASSINGGAEKVYFICGTNKITEDLHSAIHRAKNIAAPKNAQRLSRKTPCATNADKCYNCSSPERICCVTSIFSKPLYCAEVHIIIIEGSYGF